MFIGFAICPESDTVLPLDPTDIQIDAIYSRHFRQSDSYRAILLRILNIVQGELGLPHVCSFPSCVGEVTPGVETTSGLILSPLVAVWSLTDRTTRATGELLQCFCGHSLQLQH